MTAARRPTQIGALWGGRPTTVTTCAHLPFYYLLERVQGAEGSQERDVDSVGPVDEEHDVAQVEDGEQRAQLRRGHTYEDEVVPRNRGCRAHNKCGARTRALDVLRHQFME